VYEAASPDGHPTQYVYPVPSENGQSRPYVDEAMAPQGRKGYATNCPLGKVVCMGTLDIDRKCMRGVRS
jgi:hypothetical protein